MKSDYISHVEKSDRNRRGTGFYNIDGFTHRKWVKVTTPFGKPSDDLLTARLAGRDVVFLPRHGRGHRILPSELKHRANIWAMKKTAMRRRTRASRKFLSANKTPIPDPMSVNNFR